MNHAAIARVLRHSQRTLLVDHVDGSNAVPVDVFVTQRGEARAGLISMKLIRPDRPERPIRTFITDDGRQVLAHVLAEFAEALIKAGYAGVASPVDARPLPLAVLEPAA